MAGASEERHAGRAPWARTPGARTPGARGAEGRPVSTSAADDRPAADDRLAAEDRSAEDGRPTADDRRAAEDRPGEGAQPETAFVLGGGGSRGAAQVGMLAELVDRGIRADRVYGVSVGAVNAAAYCGDPTRAGMAHLEAVWRGLDGDVIFPRRRVQGPWSYFGHRTAVHSNSGLKKVLADGLRFERMEDAAVPLEVVATSLDDGLERWLTEGPAIDAVLASSAIPALFPPVRVGKELLMDGGVVDNVPVGRAVRAGAKRLYVLLCGPVHYRPGMARRPFEAVFTAFFVAVHARFARELSAIPEGVECHVFSGGADPSADYRDFSQTAELISAGRAEVRAVLDGGAAGEVPSMGAAGLQVRAEGRA